MDVTADAPPCPAWCDGYHRGWSEHMSTGWMCVVALSAEAPVRVDVGSADCPEYVSLPVELEVYLEHRLSEGSPRVVVGRRLGGEPGVRFLPVEASHVGRALIRLANMAVEGTSTACDSC